MIPIKADIQAVLNLIIAAIQPERIFLKKYSLEGDDMEYFDLLIVIPDSCQTPYSELEPITKFACLGKSEAFCSLHKSATINQALNDGHIYYSFVCTSKTLVFDTTNKELPTLSKKRQTELQVATNTAFYAGFEKSLSLYEAAWLHYRDKGLNEIIAFLLHQSIELALRALILSLKGYEKRTHSIKALLQCSRRFAPQLGEIFNQTGQDENWLQVLEEIYLNTRYVNTYKIDSGLLNPLFNHTEKLHLAASEIFENWMNPTN